MGEQPVQPEFLFQHGGGPCLQRPTGELPTVIRGQHEEPALRRATLAITAMPIRLRASDPVHDHNVRALVADGVASSRALELSQRGCVCDV